MIDRLQTDPVYLSCPECGLSIRRREALLTMQYCPRCLSRDHTAVELVRTSVEGLTQRAGRDTRKRPSSRQPTVTRRSR